VQTLGSESLHTCSLVGMVADVDRKIGDVCGVVRAEKDRRHVVAPKRLQFGPRKERDGQACHGTPSGAATVLIRTQSLARTKE